MSIITIKTNESLKLTDNVVIHNNKEKYHPENLQKISILTRDTSPFIADDVALALFFTNATLVLPSEHFCYQEIYDSLSASLPLDYAKIIKAMSCTENAEFIIWTI